jgi:hypothetical protein
MVEVREAEDMLLQMLLLREEREREVKEIMAVVPRLHPPTLIRVVEVVVLRWVLPQTDKEGRGQVHQFILVRHYFTLVEEAVVLLLVLLILEQILYQLVV